MPRPRPPPFLVRGPPARGSCPPGPPGPARLPRGPPGGPPRLPCGLGRAWGSGIGSVGIAAVRKSLSPQITGDEWPFPGMSTFHFMFLVSLQCTGASPTAIPLSAGPRQRDQFCPSAAGSPPKNAAENAATNNRAEAYRTLCFMTVMLPRYEFTAFQQNNQQEVARTTGIRMSPHGNRGEPVGSPCLLAEAAPRSTWLPRANFLSGANDRNLAAETRYSGSVWPCVQRTTVPREPPRGMMRLH